jgi:hypothetical protein
MLNAKSVYTKRIERTASTFCVATAIARHEVFLKDDVKFFIQTGARFGNNIYFCNQILKPLFTVITINL